MPIAQFEGKALVFNNGVVDVQQNGVSVVDENKVAHITTSSEGNVKIDNLTIIKNAEQELEVPFDNDTIFRDSEDGFIKAKEPSDAKIILCTQVGSDPAAPVGSFTLNQASNKTITIPIPEGGGSSLPTPTDGQSDKEQPLVAMWDYSGDEPKKTIGFSPYKWAVPTPDVEDAGKALMVGLHEGEPELFWTGESVASPTPSDDGKVLTATPNDAYKTQWKKVLPDYTASDSDRMLTVKEGWWRWYELIYNAQFNETTGTFSTDSSNFDKLLPNQRIVIPFYDKDANQVDVAFYYDKDFGRLWDENDEDYIDADGSYDLSNVCESLNFNNPYSFDTVEACVVKPTLGWSKYVAGSNIRISGGQNGDKVISATVPEVPEYTAGEGISIVNRAISIAKEWIMNFLSKTFGLGEEMYRSNEYEFFENEKPLCWKSSWNADPPEEITLYVRTGGTKEDPVFSDVTLTLHSHSEDEGEYHDLDSATSVYTGTDPYDNDITFTIEYTNMYAGSYEYSVYADTYDVDLYHIGKLNSVFLP